MFAMRGGDRVVERLAEREPERGRGPIDHWCRERERVHIDAPLVHRLHALIHHDESLIESVGNVLYPQEETISGALERGALLRAVLDEQREPLFRVPVGVNVYGAHPL